MDRGPVAGRSTGAGEQNSYWQPCLALGVWVLVWCWVTAQLTHPRTDGGVDWVNNPSVRPKGAFIRARRISCLTFEPHRNST
jgi:hypothetical protein